MVQHVSVRLSKRDTYLKGFVKLIKEKGAILSRYCSFAMQHFISNRSFIHLADVIPQENDQSIYVNLTIDEELLKSIDQSAETVKMSRGKMIKSILLNCIERSDVEYLLPEEEFLYRIFPEAKNAEPIKPVIAETPKKEEVKEEAKREIKAEIKSEKQNQSKTNTKVTPQNTLLNNFFPSVMEQAADWD